MTSLVSLAEAIVCDRALKYLAENFATDIGGAGLVIRQNATRRGEDGDPQAVVDLLQFLDFGIDPTARPRPPKIPEFDATWTMRPPSPCSTMRRAAICPHRNTPKRFVFRTLAQNASVISRNGALFINPAQDT